ncbi:MAG: LysR family transcriptional regulator, partial [Thiolinea sp.]
MTPRQIRSVLAVVETGSVNRAAAALHLAPSSVSAQIRELSASLGIALFEQAGRRIVLSPAGRALLPDFQALLGLVSDIEQQARHLAGEPAGELRLFAPSSMCIYRLPGLIEALQAEAPRLEITLTHEPFDYRNALLRRDIDAAIIVDTQPENSWRQHRLAEEQIMYVCHPKRWQPAALGLQALSRQPLITTEPGCTYRVAAERHFAQHGLSLKPRQAFSNVEVIKRCLFAD